MALQFILVDDDPVNNMVSQYMIKYVAPDARVRLFDDPEAALSAIKNEYDLQEPYTETVVFLDINMPTMSGWEFLDALNILPAGLLSHISIYILSSSIDPKDTKSAEKQPLVKGYLSKPLNKETLLALVQGRNRIDADDLPR